MSETVRSEGNGSEGASGRAPSRQPGGEVSSKHLTPDDCPDCTPSEPCCSLHDECNDEGMAHAE